MSGALRLLYDHPQSPVVNGGREYIVFVRRRGFFSWWYGVDSGSMLAGTSAWVGSGRARSYDRAIKGGKRLAKADAYSRGLTKFRPSEPSP